MKKRKKPLLTVRISAAATSCTCSADKVDLVGVDLEAEALVAPADLAAIASVVPAAVTDKAANADVVPAAVTTTVRSVPVSPKPTDQQVMHETVPGSLCGLNPEHEGQYPASPTSLAGYFLAQREARNQKLETSGTPLASDPSNSFALTDS